MGYKHWTLDDLPWDQIDHSKADPEILKIIKAAALVEYNGRDYATYLCNVFSDDPGFQQVARDWAEEEVQHGAALGRWAEIIDPSSPWKRRSSASPTATRSSWKPPNRSGALGAVS